MARRACAPAWSRIEERTIMRALRYLVPAVAVVATVVIGVNVAYAAAWSSSDTFGSWSNGGYTVRNDVWGKGAGSQSIWANSYSNFGVWANHPNTGGVKAYPHSAKYIGKNVNSVGSLTSKFNVTVPSGGAYNTSYDVWGDGTNYEIMLWVNKAGAVGAIGSKQTSVTVGGQSWDVYKGYTDHNVYSFIRRGNTNSGSVDIKAVLKWIQGKGWFSNPTIGDVQFGFEITSSSGGLNFTSNSYSVSSS
jgi:hypothetical protein